MKGYKAFGEGMACLGKQYAENTVFEEPEAEVCKAGMHFCKQPIDVLRFYPAAQAKEFAEVEALDEAKTDDGVKYCTKKLRVGAKLSLRDLVNAQVTFVREHCANEQNATPEKPATAGEYGAATAGEGGAATAGDCGAATARGSVSVGANGVGLVRAERPKARGGKGAVLVLVKENERGEIEHIVQITVDGESVKENTWYKVNADGGVEEVND